MDRPLPVVPGDPYPICLNDLPAHGRQQEMMIRTKSLICPLAVVLAGMVGCVRPGGIDPSLLSRYQKAMAKRSPQKRAGPKGLPSLRPAPGTTGPVLKIIKDEQTGRSRVELTLDQAVMCTLANNPDIAVVSFDPAISRQEMIEAAAAFDYTVFAGYTKSYTDERTATVFGGGRTSINELNVGIKQKTITGADWSVTYDMTRTWDDSAWSTMSERYEPTLELSITQPLLRDAWPGFNLATLRIARINRKISMARFREVVEQTATDAIGVYWLLVQARKNRDVEKSLLDMTLDTLRMVEGRAERDATAVEINQIKSAVEARRARLIRAAKTILDVQHQLARLLAHEQINVLSDYQIVPVTKPATTKVKIEAADQLVTALRHSPLLERARLEIAVAGENVKVARNQLLPRLDLAASTTWQGLGHTSHFANEQLNSGDYLSYSLGLTFEYPIGNRQRRAAMRRTRMERLKAIAQLQAVADDVAISVAERIREINTTFDEIQAQQDALKAAKTHLKALEDTEIRRRLSPEYLNVKLIAQESVARSELAELQAIVSYNTAMVELARNTGTVLEINSVKIALPAAIDQQK